MALYMREAVNVVIGGGSGMGAAVAGLLAPRGRLLIADLNTDAADAVAAGLGASSIFCDLLDGASIDALVARVDKYGRLGTLVITAGLSPSMSSGRKIFDVNLSGTAYAVDAFEKIVGPESVAVCFASIAGHLFSTQDQGLLSLLDNPRSPTIVDDLIAAGINTNDPATAYGYSKFGVIRLCKRKAAVWGKLGARIVSVSPGIISTPMGDLEFENQPAMKDMLNITPLKRMGEAEEVAMAVEYLTSQRARYLTGIDLLVDGGLVSACT
jgi:NAD(P)-dependent dehydrogenase (short-subunit alcohol dehydrogenase family)